MEFKDYYSTLGVAKTATDKEIKQAYRKLARKFHPDVNPGDKAADDRFKEINEAYEVLGDAAKRTKYDELGANWRLYEQAQQAYGNADRGPWSTWSVNVGGPEGYRTMTEEEAEQIFGGSAGDPFSDFFKTFFGGAQEPTERRGRSRTRKRAGGDVGLDVELDLEETMAGVTRRITVKSGGHARSVDVRIPAGVKDGSRVRVAGEGEPGSGGAAAGDLYLTIRLRPHDRFERRGTDLHVKVPVPMTTAVLGGSASVPTLDGKSLRLKVPEGTQNGQVFRLRGHGMPSTGHPEQRGDLYATVDVVVPKTISAEQRRHFEALAKLDGEGN